jgi:hypothetical protein
MLTLNGHRFATGQTTYRGIHPERVAGKQAIYIQVILPIDTGMDVYAMVDTGLRIVSLIQSLLRC